MSKAYKPKKKIVINPIEGELDIVTGNNFSYESVPLNKKIKIRENEQMAVFESFEVEGELQLDGTLVLED
ncbi:MAG TPA: hypothetical protein PKI14_12780 [Fervidobacterium sp.]|nr:hypothetical protein [Fervidobacterium sp.]